MTQDRKTQSAKLNRILAIVALLLLAVSVYAYTDSVTRAERFERGQKLLPNLNPDEVSEIVIAKGDEETVLERGEEAFTVTGADGYRAKNETVNRFIADILKVSLEKEVGRGADLAQELGLVETNADMVQVGFKDANGKDMVRFRVGNAAEDGGGSYVQRVDTADDPIYLTSSQVYMNTEAHQFLDKEILDVTKDEIVRVSGADYVIEREEVEDGEGDLVLVEMPSGKKKKAEPFSKATSMLAYLRFDAHHLANAAVVDGLNWSAPVDVALKDGSGYRLQVAERSEKHFLRIEAFHEMERVEITMETSEEEVREKSEILARADELQEFNNYHGSWIYEVSEATAEKVRLRKRDLVEDA